MTDKVRIVDILKAYIKGDHIEWHSEGICTYKKYEILGTGNMYFGDQAPKAGFVWVRTSMPDFRENWLNPAEPDFFERLDAALIPAKKCIDETEDTKEALNAFRNHLGY